MEEAGTKAAMAVHPYFPLDLHLPSYVPLQVDFVYILGVFFSAVVLVFAGTWALSGEEGGIEPVSLLAMAVPKTLAIDCGKPPLLPLTTATTKHAVACTLLQVATSS